LDKLPRFTGGGKKGNTDYQNGSESNGTKKVHSSKKSLPRVRDETKTRQRFREEKEQPNHW